MALEIDLSGRTVLVTGGTKGVGRGIAHRFADAGATVVVCARREADDPLPPSWHFVAADLRDPEAAAAAVDAAAAVTGRLDCVVNNAGGSPPADSAEAPARFTQRIVELNLLAPYWVAQRAHHHMTAQGGGSIVNIGSVVAIRPSPTTAAYGAAKAGLRQLTTTLAMEWAPTIRVNTITVGLILTEQAHLFYGEGEARARIEGGIPMGRFAVPTDIGDIAVWLASDLASYVTGAEIAAHGGGERPPFLDAGA